MIFHTFFIPGGAVTDGGRVTAAQKRVVTVSALGAALGIKAFFCWEFLGIV